MKKLTKNFKRSLIAFSVMLAILLVPIFGLSLKSAVAEAESIVTLKVEFASSSDKIMLGENEFSGDFSYDRDLKKVLVEGEETSLRVVSECASFKNWTIASTSALNGFETLPLTFEKEFNLNELLDFIYQSNPDNYLRETGDMHVLTLFSRNEHGTTFEINSSVISNGSLTLGGAVLKGNIELDYNTTYKLCVTPKAHYLVRNVKIYKGADFSAGNDPIILNDGKAPFEFTTGIQSRYSIFAAFEKNAYPVKVRAVDQDMNALDSSLLTTTSTFGRVDSLFDKKIEQTPSKEYRIKEFRATNVLTGAVEVVDILSVQESEGVFSSDFFDKYVNSGIVQLTAVFENLEEVKIKTMGEGSVAVFVNDIEIDNEQFQSGLLTLYVGLGDKIRVEATPGEGYSLVEFRGSKKGEVVGNVLELENISESRNLTVIFDRDFYRVEMFAVDQNSQQISWLDEDIALYVNMSASSVVHKNDNITKIVASSSDPSYRFVGFEIYNQLGSRGWESFSVVSGSGVSVNDSFLEKYLIAGENKVFIRAKFAKVYLVSVSIEDASAGFGYFDLEILNAKGEVIESHDKITSYNEYLDSGLRVRVTARGYSGYEFSQFTIDNANPADKHIITKTVRYEDIVFACVFERVETALDVNLSGDKANLSMIGDNTVKVGDKITISHSVTFTRKLDKILVNGINADKLDNVEVTDNAIIITITSDFLASLEGNKINIKAVTSHNASFISLVIVVPILLALLVAGFVVILIYFLKSRKELNRVKNSEHLK